LIDMAGGARNEFRENKMNVCSDMCWENVWMQERWAK